MPDIPLSLYIHIPWCVKKCPYCDFNSHEVSAIPESEYVDRLIEDLKQDLHYVQGRRLHSIFFGGGTPSLFSAKAIANILQAVESEIGFEDDIEITLEANPGTAEQEKFSGFYQAGVNRLSIGVQSFNNKSLAALGRIHNGDEAKSAFAMARKAGFKNINLDLMHGLPGQNLEQALNDLQLAIELQPEHISWYQLTIEPNTSFYNAPPVLPLEADLSNIQDRGHKLLLDAYYQQYEVSAYSRNHKASMHNVNYWQFGDYLGIGAGAHGKITIGNKSNGSVKRYWKMRQPMSYLSCDNRFLAGEKTLSQNEIPLEFAMNALRLQQGFSEALFEERTGQSINVLADRIDSCVDKGLLESRHHHVNATALGRRFLNDVLASFL